MTADALRQPKSKIELNLELRSQQVAYLRLVGEREDLPASHVLSRIIEANAHIAPSGGALVARKARLHVFLNLTCLAILDALARRWGLSRSDVVMRLVDDAQACDPWMGANRPLPEMLSPP